MRTPSSTVVPALVAACVVGLTAPSVAQKNISVGKVYAYYKIVPGQAPNHYQDDGRIGGLHAVHTRGLGVFGFGNMTDGATSSFAGTGPVTNHIAIRGANFNAPAAEIIIDLGGPAIVSDFVLGTVVAAALNNNAPDDVTVSYSTKTTAAGDFVSAQFYDLEKTYGPLADGHHDLAFKGSNLLARYVKFSFDGGSMAEPNGTDPDEKYMLDEITIRGTPLGCTAQATNYGAGLAGRGGVPALTMSAPPVFLQTVNVLAANSSGAASQGMFVMGVQQVAIPFLGGTLLAKPDVVVGAPVPLAGIVLPVKIPGGICGVPVYLQFLQLDAAAAGGVAMSRGLKIEAGS